MNAETHADPFQDAMSHGLQRALQVASSVMTGAHVYAYLKRTQAMAAAEQDERARRVLAAQIRADREAARSGWAPALDPDWLRQADLLQAARTWGTAMPYADRSVPWYEPAAATAMRKSEERLRDLHPYAMSRYDRLRADGFAPADAMREAAPLFARPPRTHDSPYTPRPVLDTGTGENLTWASAGPPPPADGPGSPDLAEAQERRGGQIVAALHERARKQHRDPLGEAEQRTVLEAITNLPPDIIDRVARRGPSTAISRPEGTGATADTAAAHAMTMHAGQTGRPWEHDFPVSIQTVMATAAGATAKSPAAPARTPGLRHPQRDLPRR